MRIGVRIDVGAGVPRDGGLGVGVQGGKQVKGVQLGALDVSEGAMYA